MGGFANNAPIVTDGLVFYVDAGNDNSYPGSGGTWSDLVGSNDGALTNMDATNHSSANGGVFTFDGSNEIVDFGNILNMGTSDMSFFGWAKRTGGDGELEWIMSKSYAGPGVGRYWIDFDNNTTLRVAAAWAEGHTDYRFSGTFSQDVWYNYAAVFDRNDKLYLYINGSLNTSYDISSHSSVNMTNTYPYRIGSYTGSNQSTPQYFLSGEVSCHLHYNKALTASEILQNYNALKNRFV